MAWRKSSWAKAIFSSSAFLFGSSRKKQPYRTRLLLESLEDRCVPTTFMPTTFADGVLGSGSLRDAVLQANADTGTDDDIILLDTGTYALTIVNTGGHHETAGLQGDLNITSTSHRLIVQGAGSSTIIDASQLQDRVFQIVNPGTVVVFQDLVIQGGLAQDDGTAGTLAGSTDGLGGGILNNGGNITLDNVVVQNNVARGGDVTVLTVPGHNASGGGIYSTGGALTMAGATIASNLAIGGRGGDHHGFTHAGDGGSASGGGLYATAGSLDISNSTIASNLATGGQGGDGNNFTTKGGGNGGYGGVGQGGGLYVNGGSLTIATSTIASNEGTAGAGGPYGQYGYGQGGGLYNGGTLTVSNSSLPGNTASGSYGFGGGILNRGTLTVSNSTLSANSAIFYGGGIFNINGTLTVSNSTLSANSAVYGGGIYNLFYLSTYPVTLTNVTITANRANHSGPFGSGGGLYVEGGSPVLHNTLIAGNFTGATGTTRDDVSGSGGPHGDSGPLDPGGDYNLIGDGTHMIGLTNGVNGNLVGSAAVPINPRLGPLQDNGGPTMTHALLAGSPALNAGNQSQLGVADQRGVVRAGGVNIGAYQASASAFVVTVSGTVTAGTPFDVTVQAVDVFGQVAFGYRGTVTFSVTDPDPAVMMPADYSFSADDQGTHRFTGEFTLIAPGIWTLTAADLTNGLSQDVMVTVNS
jgi:hypothetical protein